MRFRMESGSSVLDLTPGEICTFDSDMPTNCQHSHGIYEMTVVISGQGIFKTGESEYPLRKGDVFVVNPDCVHEIRIPDSRKGKLSVYYFSFWVAHPTSWKPRTEEEKLMFDFLKSHSLHKSDQRSLLEYLKFLEVYKSKEDFLETGIRNIYFAFAMDAMSRLKTGKYHAVGQLCPNHIVDDAVGYIAFHFAEKITLEELAGHCRTSVRNLQLLFRKHMGCSVIDYCNRIKMNHAACYLSMSDKVSEAGIKVGIQDGSQFSRMFKKYFGVSPLEYQRRESRLSSYLLEDCSGSKK